MDWAFQLADNIPRIRGAQHEADLEPRFALLDIDNPVPAHADFLGQGLLVKTQGFLRARIRAPRSIGLRIRIYHLCS